MVKSSPHSASRAMLRVTVSQYQGVFASVMAHRPGPNFRSGNHTSARMRRIFIDSGVMKKLLFHRIGALKPPSYSAAPGTSWKKKKRSALVLRARSISARLGAKPRPKSASHVAGSEKDRPGSSRAAIEQLLAGVMEMRAHPCAGGELAGSELDAGAPVYAAIPRAEIAMREHAVGKLAAKFQQARAVRRFRQRCARADGLPTREEGLGQPVELGPKRVLARCRGIEIDRDRRRDPELGGPPVLRDGQIPGERVTDRRILPNLQALQLAHGVAPGNRARLSGKPRQLPSRSLARVERSSRASRHAWLRARKTK